jgi:hypothetical protein
VRALRAPTLAQTRRAYYWWEAGAPRACVGVTRTFDVYPPLIVPWEKEGFLRHRSSCSALRAERARSGGVRARGETREGRGAMRDILRKNLISPKPRKRPLAVVKTELPAWREMQPSQSFEQKFRAPPAPPPCRLIGFRV